MNLEETRLETFNDWPSDAVVDPVRIAKAGFFSTKQELTVECFSCHIQISEWNYGDQVMAKHKNLSPTCPFVLNPTTSGNIPIISNTILSPVTSTSTSTSQEDARLATFENWPVSNIVTPESLARSGFFYKKKSDMVECAYCNGIVRAWEPGDDPDLEHKKHFPNCSFVKNVIIPRISTNNVGDKSIQNVHLVDSKDLDALGVQKHNGPKNLEYGTLESRQRSFTSWPPDLMQKPDILSQAGFYYEGVGDQVRCFHCDGGLKHWDPQDDPWTEHARWFPACSYVKLVKGQNFVTLCAQETQEDSTLEEVSLKPTSSVPNKRRHVTDREIQEYLNSPVALAALGIGLNIERVKRAIKEKLEQTGRAYSQPDALVEATLNLQFDEDDEAPPEGEISYMTNIVAQQLTDTIKQTVNTPTSDKNNKSSNTEASSPNIDKKLSLEEENRQLKEARLCKICMDSEVGIVFLPCGHLATCVTCAPNLEHCPVCRSSIKATVRTFLS